MNIHAGLDVAVRVSPSSGNEGVEIKSGPADCLLYADGWPIGVVEAKPPGHTLEYENTDAGATGREVPRVAYGRRSFYVMINDTVEGVWSPFGQRRNPDLLGQQVDLRPFLIPNGTRRLRSVRYSGSWRRASTSIGAVARGALGTSTTPSPGGAPPSNQAMSLSLPTKARLEHVEPARDGGASRTVDGAKPRAPLWTRGGARQADVSHRPACDPNDYLAGPRPGAEVGGTGMSGSGGARLLWGDRRRIRLAQSRQVGSHRFPGECPERPSCSAGVAVEPGSTPSFAPDAVAPAQAPGSPKASR